MANRVTPTYARGFLTHAKALAPWPEETTATQAGPRAGEAVAQARSDGSYPTLALRTSGEQEADSSLTITVRQGGHVGDLTYSWSDGLADHRGWDNGIHVSTFEPIEWADDSRYPHAASTPDGYIYVIVYRPSAYSVRVYRRTPSTGNWTESVLYTADADPGETLHGCLAVDGSGAIWAYHWIVDPDEERAQVRVHVRRPGGTWTTVQNRTLESEISVSASVGYTLGRIRAAINDGGQTLMMAHLKPNSGAPAADVIAQWASEHPAAPLREVAQDLGGRGYPDVVIKDGQFWCFYLIYNEPSPSTAYGDPIVRVVGSAFESIETADPVNIPEGLSIQEARVDGTPEFTEGELAAVVAEDGTVYLYTQAYDGAPPSPVQGHVYRFRGTLASPKSTVQANGWDALGSGASATWHKSHPSADTTEYPANIAACIHRGRVFIAANPQTTVTGTQDYLVGYYLGGYSTAARPSLYFSHSDPDRDPLEYGYVPIAGPTSFGWTPTTSGTASAAVSLGALDISTTAGTQYYTITGTGGDGGYARFKVDPTSGGSFSADAVALTYAVTDGANIWSVTVRVATSGGTTQFRVVDTAGSTILDDVDTGQSEPIEILVSLIQVSTAASCFVFWRVWDTSEDTVWQEAQASATVPSGAGTAPFIRWGHVASGTATSTWGYVLWSWSGGPINLARLERPGDMPGAVLPASPRYVADGVYVAGTDGPGITGDEFAVSTAYEYGIDRLDPRQHPSPSEAWHSLTDTDPATIAYVTNTFVEDAQLDTDVLGLYVAGANMRGFFLDRYDVALADWVNAGELNLAEGKESLPFLRRGDTITPDPDGVYEDEPWFAAGELVGNTVDLGSQALRKVRWNTEGWWSTQTGRRRVVIQLEDVDGTEPADGNCDIWASRGFLAVHLAGKLQGGLRLSIPDQDTADGYFSLGIAVIGPVTTFARDFGLGGQETRAAIAELTTLANGYAQARALNTTQRIWAIPLSDLASEIELYAGDGRYMLGTDTSGGLVLANRGDEWSKLDGLIQYSDGPVSTVVYAPLVKISDGTEDEQVYTAERHMIYGRLGLDVSRSLEQGTPEEGWVWRGDDTLVITEEK